MYTLNITISSLSCWMSILGSALSAIKPRSVKNTRTFWFHNLPDCLRLYIFCNRRATSRSLIALNDFIPGGNFMKIDRLLSVRMLSRYALTISTWSTKNSNKEEMVRNMHSDSLLTVGEKVFLKSILCIYEKPCAMSFGLYQVTDLSNWYLTLNTYLDLTAFLPDGSWLYS